MPSGWAKEEVEATVADYFSMLRAQLADTSYSKTDHRRKLLPMLHDRSAQSVEFKHANISAVLIEFGFPFITGYKPRSNYQRKMLPQVVWEHLAANPEIQRLAANDVERPAKVPTVEDILKALVAPPKPVVLKNRIASPTAQYSAAPVNYLEREANNRSLGLAGEEFVINFERARLIHAGRENLASKIEHVAKVRGDAAGYDVLSFERSGEEKLIEVKTTKYGAHTPFFVSRNELEVSRASASRYYLYRVFEFRVQPFLFALHGALSSTCSLDPNTYIARVA